MELTSEGFKNKDSDAVLCERNPSSLNISLTVDSRVGDFSKLGKSS